MTARLDHNPWSGPRLPHAKNPPRQKVVQLVEPLPPEPIETAHDPAHGERVPRCRICGVPGLNGNRVLEGAWSRGALVIAVRFCERCIREIAPFDPRSGDPLQVA